MLNPEHQSEKKKRGAKKTRSKMRDLSPRKETRGGGGILPRDPPLPIPPPGFIIDSDAAEPDRGQS